MGGRARRVGGEPDMVLEVVSDSSVHKDTVVLRQGYWQAGIREYWLVDARREPVYFDILRRTTKGYAAASAMAGSSRSFSANHFNLSKASTLWATQNTLSPSAES